MKPLSRYGEWAVVAGASEGIGSAFAEALAAAKRSLMLIARRQDVLAKRAEELASRYGVAVRTLALDLGMPDAAERIDAETADIDVGIAVYNAAVSMIGPFLDSTLLRHMAEIDVNCRGPLSFAYRFAARFVEQGRGAIVLMSSMSASQGSPFIANYAATKAYNLTLAEGLWYELKARGVDIIASCAGATDTPNFRKSSPASAMGALPPAVVARETFRALGKYPSVIPGRMNRLMACVMNRLFPRRTAVNIMGGTLASMYGVRTAKNG